MSDEEEVSSVSDDGSDVSTEMSPGLRRLLDAVIDKSDPDALQKLLAKRQEELDRCLASVLMDEDLPVDEKLKYGKVLLEQGPSDRTKSVCLWESIWEFEYEVTDMVLKYGVDVNVLFDNEQSPLHVAACFCPTQTVETMLAAGFDVNSQDADGRIPLFNTVRNFAPEGFRLLLPISDITLTAYDGRTALHNLLRSSLIDPSGREEFCIEAVNKLIEKGVDVNALTDDQFSALSDACTMGNVQTFEALIKAGCDVNALGFGSMTVLDQVAQKDTTPKADGVVGFVNQGDQEDMTDPNKPTPEDVMTAMGKILIQAGADVDGTHDFEYSPLMSAIVTRKCRLVRELLQANCNTDMVRKVTFTHLGPQAICNFLQASVKNHTMDCATYIFVDCCSKPELQDVQEIFFEYFATKKELLAEQGIHPSPVSLSRLCRVTLRDALPRGCTFQGAVDRLPLAPHVRRFVGLRS